MWKAKQSGAVRGKWACILMTLSSVQLEQRTQCVSMCVCVDQYNLQCDCRDHIGVGLSTLLHVYTAPQFQGLLKRVHMALKVTLTEAHLTPPLSGPLPPITPVRCPISLSHIKSVKTAHVVYQNFHNCSIKIICAWGGGWRRSRQKLQCSTAEILKHCFKHICPDMIHQYFWTLLKL